MKKARYIGEQIDRVLQEVVAGRPIREVFRHHGITEMTFYLWRTRYSDLQVSEPKRFKGLEDENRHLRKLASGSRMPCPAPTTPTSAGGGISCWLWHMTDTQQQIEARRVDYNEIRPHKGLQCPYTEEFTETLGQAEAASITRLST